MMNFRYRLPHNLKRFERRGRIILINPDRPSWVVTDKVGETILSLFNGAHSLDEVINLATEALGESNRGKVALFCKGVIASFLFDKADESDIHHPYNLNMVHLSLSSACNLHCKYCYAAERKEGAHEKLNLEDYKNLIDDIRKINPEVGFTITGGEPLLNPLWKDVSQYIHDGGNYIILLSNATLFDEENIKSIKALFDLVTVSVDGSNSVIHSLTRGGNYDKVMHGLNLLNENGVNYTVSMTVTRNNIDDVGAMARKYGSRLNYAPLFPVSDLSNNELSITGIEYYEALKSASGVNPMAFCENALERSLHAKCFKCSIGDGEISISPTGDVYPCQLLHNNNFFAGNIRENTIENIYRHSPVLRRCANLTVDNVEGCPDCAVKYICGGACRARAFYEKGDIAGHGDFCNYELEAFLDGIVGIYSKNMLEVTTG